MKPKKREKPTIVMITAFSPPITGYSVASDQLRAMLNDSHNVVSINLSNAGFRRGAVLVRKWLSVLNLLIDTYRATRGTDITYIGFSQSFMGNAKDLCLVLVSRSRRVIGHLHGGGIRDALFTSGFIRAANRFVFRVLRNIDVIVLSESLRGQYRRIVPEARIHVMKNAVDESLFTTHEEIDRKFREPVTRFLFLSNLMPGKGWEETIAAFKALPEEIRAQSELHIAGVCVGAHARRAVTAARSIPNITYHRVVTGQAKRDLLFSTHVLVLPSYYRYEGQPLTILEAYASGHSVLTTDQGGIPDIFTDRVNGIRLERRSVESVAAAMVAAHTARADTAAYAHANLDRALGDHTLSRHLETFLSVTGHP